MRKRLGNEGEVKVEVSRWEVGDFSGSRRRKYGRGKFERLIYVLTESETIFCRRMAPTLTDSSIFY